MVEKEGSQLSVRRQCELLGLNRNRLDGPTRGGLGEGDLEMARRIDEIHLRLVGAALGVATTKASFTTGTARRGSTFVSTGDLAGTG